MSIATTDEQRALQESIRSWAQRSEPVSWLRAVADLDNPKLRQKLRHRLDKLAGQISKQLPPPTHGKHKTV